MIDSGWVNEVSKGLTAEARKIICATLNERHAAIFKDKVKQDDFLRLINGLWQWRDATNLAPLLDRDAKDFPKLNRGEKLRDRPQNQSRLIASQLALRYKTVFSKQPNANPDGAFSQILSVVLEQMQLPVFGEDALQNVFDGKV
jgi:hypothetical protein